MISTAIQQLVNYGLDTGLILPDDEIYIRNQLLMTMQLDSFTEPEGDICYTDLESILKTLVDDAVARGVCEDNSTARDLFDTKLMGVLTPRPSIVRANFEERYESEGPQAATDWFYEFSQDTDYIRRYRIKRDVKWVTKTPYGDLDITINLSKPEKDPKAIAAAKLAPQSAYPKCQLCVENEGYAGRMNHPARENHRIIPLTINGSAWNLQYSPYVYYNEHCIVFNSQHTPMKIERATFRKLLDFVSLFPHYFVGDVYKRQALKIDADAFRNAIRFNMTEDDLAELMKSKMMSTSATYESNLQAFGYASEDDPSQINIYPLDFEQKAKVLNVLDSHNAAMREQGAEDKVIQYTDMVGTLMTLSLIHI